MCACVCVCVCVCACVMCVCIYVRCKTLHKHHADMYVSCPFRIQWHLHSHHYLLNGHNAGTQLGGCACGQLADTLLVVSSVLLNLTHNNVISDHFIKLEWDQSTGMTVIQALCTIHTYRTYAHTVSTYVCMYVQYIQHNRTYVLCT